MKTLALALFLTALAAPVFASGNISVTSTTSAVTATVVADGVNDNAAPKEVVRPRN